LYGENIEVHLLSHAVKEIKLEILKFEEKAAPLLKEISSLYDYWPETPPDWEERKVILKSKSQRYCSKCGKYNVEKHVHHKVPVSRGGSHRLENLEYLCVKCHSKVHHGRNVSVENKTITSINRPTFSNRLELIKYAIDNNRIIRFKYEKFDGEVSNRSIRPKNLKQKGKSLCVEGFCNLRKADRIFAVKRMTGVRIEE
jgi:Zn finger protein HypA/HybF involved in hydrogenase expression